MSDLIRRNSTVPSGPRTVTPTAGVTRQLVTMDVGTPERGTAKSRSGVTVTPWTVSKEATGALSGVIMLPYGLQYRQIS